jgi:hypothetical protein
MAASWAHLDPRYHPGFFGVKAAAGLQAAAG